MSKLKVTTLFSGIGAQEAGLKRLGVDFELVGMCEIDKYAIKSYEAINGPTHNYGDISKLTDWTIRICLYIAHLVFLVGQWF